MPMQKKTNNKKRNNAQRSKRQVETLVSPRRVLAVLCGDHSVFRNFLNDKRVECPNEDVEYICTDRPEKILGRLFDGDLILEYGWWTVPEKDRIITYVRTHQRA
jgi:hypothetical protein